MSLVQFIFEIIACYGLSYAIMHALAHTTRHSYIFFRSFLLPGIILHETSHALACLLTGTPIVSLSFWNETGGHVIHHKPKYALVAQPFISIAPFIAGVAFLFFASTYLSFEAWFRSIILLMLMISVAATLAPSKTDLINAAEGGIIVILILIATSFYSPSFIQLIAPKFTSLNQPILLVDGILLVIWLVLTSFHKTVGARLSR